MVREHSHSELSTKIHVVADLRCRPIALLTSLGQHGDSPKFIPLPRTIRIWLRDPGLCATSCARMLQRVFATSALLWQHASRDNVGYRPTGGGRMTDEIVDGIAALLPSAEVMRGQFARGARRIRWVEVAGTGPTVVFEAGAGATALSWLHVIRELAEHDRVRLVAYDRAGIGASDPIGGLGRVSLDTQVGDLVAVLDALARTGGPCILVAHSWGGLLAQVAAWSRPELIAGMVLVDASHEQAVQQIPKRALRGMLVNRVWWALLASSGIGRRTLRTEAAAAAAALSNDSDVRARLAAADLAYYTGTRRIFATLVGEMRTAYRGTAQMARRRTAPDAVLPAVPLVVLSADPDKAGSIPGPVASALVAQHRAIAEQVPGARHELAEGSGHFIQLDRPERVVRAVREVLDGATRVHAQPSTTD